MIDNLLSIKGYKMLAYIRSPDMERFTLCPTMIFFLEDCMH